MHVRVGKLGALQECLVLLINIVDLPPSLVDYRLSTGEREERVAKGEKMRIRSLLR